MTGSDDEFEDFLKVRRHKFRPPDDMFEPPAELDRLVLRQAREAIETPRPPRALHHARDLSAPTACASCSDWRGRATPRWLMAPARTS